MNLPQEIRKQCFDKSLYQAWKIFSAQVIFPGITDYFFLFILNNS